MLNSNHTNNMLQKEIMLKAIDIMDESIKSVEYLSSNKQFSLLSVDIVKKLSKSVVMWSSYVMLSNNSYY